MTRLRPSARSVPVNHRFLTTLFFLAMAAALAGCAGPFGSAFSDPEISIQPPQSGITPYGLYQPSTTQF